MPTSRWVISDICDGCTYSTGSSTVMMWPGEVRLRWSIIAASVVDLPEPVAPTTRTRPRLVITTSFSTAGSFSFSKFGISEAIVRITMPTQRCCTKTLTRKRETPGIEMAKLHSISFANSARCVSFISEWASIRVTSAASFCVGQRLHRALRLHARREVGGDEEIGAAGLAHRRQQLVHVGARLFFGEGCRHGAP